MTDILNLKYWLEVETLRDAQDCKDKLVLIVLVIHPEKLVWDLVHLLRPSFLVCKGNRARMVQENVQS